MNAKDSAIMARLSLNLARSSLSITLVGFLTHFVNECTNREFEGCHWLKMIETILRMTFVRIFGHSTLGILALGMNGNGVEKQETCYETENCPDAADVES
jgi:hypothetical protein